MISQANQRGSMERPWFGAVENGSVGDCLTRKQDSNRWLIAGLALGAGLSLLIKVVWILRFRNRRKTKCRMTNSSMSKTKNEAKERVFDESARLTECLLSVVTLSIGAYMMTTPEMMTHPFVSKSDVINHDDDDEEGTGRGLSITVSISLGIHFFSLFHHTDRTFWSMDELTKWYSFRSGYLTVVLVLNGLVFWTGENLFALGAVLLAEVDMIFVLFSHQADLNTEDLRSKSSARRKISLVGCAATMLARALAPSIYCCVLVIVTQHSPLEMSRISITMFAITALSTMMFAVFVIKSQTARLHQGSSATYNDTPSTILVHSPVSDTEGEQSADWRYRSGSKILTRKDLVNGMVLWENVWNCRGRLLREGSLSREASSLNGVSRVQLLRAKKMIRIYGLKKMEQRKKIGIRMRGSRENRSVLTTIQETTELV